MTDPKIDNKPTKDIRIDTGLHRLLKMKASEASLTIKQLLELYLADILAVDGGDKHANQ